MSNIVLNRWMVMLLLLPHLGIYYFRFDQFKNLTFGLQFGVVIVSLFLIYRNINKFNTLLIFYMGIVLLSAYLNSNLSSGIFFTVVVFTSFCIYVSYAMRNFKELITGLYYLLSTVVILNFLTMIIFPNGIATGLIGDPIYLLDGKNSIEFTVFPTIPLVYLYSYFNYQKLKKIPLTIILICIASIFLSASGTGIVVALLTFLFVFLPKRFFPTFNSYLVIYIATFLSIVIFRLQEVLFGNFIVNVLHKDITFTGRTYIWDIAIRGVEESWLIGLGRGNMLIHSFFSNLSESHDGTLDVLLYSGVLGLALFLIILLLVGKKLKLYRKHIISKVLSFSIFAYMVIGLTESVFYKIEFWLLLVIAYNLDEVSKQINQTEICREKTQNLAS